MFGRVGFFAEFFREFCVRVVFVGGGGGFLFVLVLLFGVFIVVCIVGFRLVSLILVVSGFLGCSFVVWILCRVCVYIVFFGNFCFIF